MPRKRTAAMQVHYDRAYRDTLRYPTAAWAFEYLSVAVTSGRYAVPALVAIAEGMDQALKDRS